MPVKENRDALRPPPPLKVKLNVLKKPPITAWSLSRLKLYEKCPLQFRLKHVEKLPESGNAAMARGDKIHKALEAYVKTGGTMPAEIHIKLRPKVKWLREQFTRRNVNVEGELAFNVDWQPTSWFGADAYVRIKIDVLYLPKKDSETMKIIDYKTGGIREGEYDDTLELYGMAGLATGAGATADGELWFTDHGIIVPNKKPLKLSMLPKLTAKWDARAKPLLSDKRFAPRPGDYCRYCTWRKSNGGPCAY